MSNKEKISTFVRAVTGVLGVLGFAAIAFDKTVDRNIIAWAGLATITFSSFVNAQSDTPTQQLRPPAGFVAPPLNPTGVTLETRRIAEGVYALLANTPFTDNSGFVVGADAVLVVDSQFNGRMGQQVLDAVRRVTDKPIRYLVNTNAFGDHTFGNYVFPDETRIVGHRRTLEAMRGNKAEEIGRRMAATVDNDLSVFDGVKVRLPDEIFDDTWSVDLGGRRVEAHFFGAGMSPSDTVVYVPGAQVAWTGNLVFGENTIPWAQSGGIATYRQTLVRLSNALEIATIVPGHGALTTGSTVATYMRYLDEVTTIVTRSLADDTISVDQLVSTASVPATFPIEPSLVSLMTGFHRWNLQRAFREIQ
jgi:cyclase